MSMNQYYPVLNGEERPLTLRDGKINLDEEFEENVFTYDGTGQKPTIKVVNGGNQEVLDVDAGDYADNLTEETDAEEYPVQEALKGQGNYSDSVEVVWSIAKAQAKVSITAKDDIVYDGAPLGISNFNITADENDTLSQQFIREMKDTEEDAGKIRLVKAKTKTSVTPIRTEVVVPVTYENHLSGGTNINSGNAPSITDT